jgi:hypothetical protein
MKNDVSNNREELQSQLQAYSECGVAAVMRPDTSSVLPAASVCFLCARTWLLAPEGWNWNSSTPIHPVRNPASRVQCLETRGKCHRTVINTSDVLGLQLPHRTSLIKTKFYEQGVIGADKVLALLRCYATCVGSCLPTFSELPIVPSSRVKQSLEHGRDKLSRNAIKQLHTSTA